MVPEFADALFDAEDLQQGDIIGPVRSEFGWHVILFDEARGTARRAPGRGRGGAGRRRRRLRHRRPRALRRPHGRARAARSAGRSPSDLDDVAQLALTAIDVGEHSQAIDERARLHHLPEARGGHAAARRRRGATHQRADRLRASGTTSSASQAEDAGDISIDDSVYESRGRHAGRLIAGHGWARRLRLVHGAVRLGQVDDRGGPRAPAATPAAARSPSSTVTSCARTSRKGLGFAARTATPTSGASATWPPRSSATAASSWRPW